MIRISYRNTLSPWLPYTLRHYRNFALHSSSCCIHIQVAAVHSSLSLRIYLFCYMVDCCFNRAFATRPGFRSTFESLLHTFKFMLHPSICYTFKSVATHSFVCYTCNFCYTQVAAALPGVRYRHAFATDTLKPMAHIQRFAMCTLKRPPHTQASATRTPTSHHSRTRTAL